MARDDFGDTRKFCKHCGSVSFPRIKTVKEGNPKTGCLWTILFLPVGLFYFAFRMRTEEFWVCGVCDRRGGLIPTDSPVAKAAIHTQSKTNEGIYCTSCGKPNQAGATYCFGCGHKLQAEMNAGSLAGTLPGYGLIVEPDARYKMPKKAGGTYGNRRESSLWALAGTFVGRVIFGGWCWQRIVVGILIILAFAYYLQRSLMS